MKELDRGNLDNELYVAEYNYENNTFHHTFLKNSMSTNEKNIKRFLLKEAKKPNLSWVAFSIGTYEETADDIEKMRKFIKQTI